MWACFVLLSLIPPQPHPHLPLCGLILNTALPSDSHLLRFTLLLLPSLSLALLWFTSLSFDSKHAALH